MAETKKHVSRVKDAAENVIGKIKISRSGSRAEQKTPRGNRTKLLVSIVNQRDDGKLKEVLEECSVSLSLSFAGTGTARSSVLDYLGIGETEKAVVLSLFPESDEDRILREIQTKMSLYLVGRGISFTVPLSGVSEIIANGLQKAAAEKMDGSKIMKSQDRKYDLIIAAVRSGSADDAMEAARSAGAAGGTIIRARTLDNAKAQQFIGISLATEQEILLILSKRESKLAIMEALSERVGLKSDAGGVIFSLPVDKTAGIGAAGETDEQSGKSAEASETPKGKEGSAAHEG